MIAIVIVNYNGASDTVECIESVNRSTLKDLRIIVIDNGSADESTSLLSSMGFDNVELIFLEENIGFSGGNNVGIRRALDLGAEKIMLLNNDTIVDCEMIGLLSERCDERSVSAPCMFYYSDPNKTWYAGGYFDRFGIPRHITTIEKSGKIDYVTGCCLMLHRSTVERVGFWDEDYFLYWEDAAYSKRLAESGVRITLVPEACLLHKVSASTGGSESPQALYYLLRNKILFINRFDS